MRRLACFLACFLLLGAQAHARQITGKTNVGSFSPQPTALKLTAELVVASADNVLKAGERGTINIGVSNVGGGSAEGVNVRLTASPSLQGVSIPPTIEIGSIEKGGLKNSTVDVVVDKNAKSQRAVLSIQAFASSGAKSDPVSISLSVKEQPPVPMVARDFTPPAIEIVAPVRLTTSTPKTAPGTPHFTTSSSSVSVNGIARDSSGVAIVLVNGEETKFTLTSQGAEFTSSVLLAMGRNEVEVRAVDRFKNESRLLLLVQREEQMIQGAYYALVIAVQDYQDPRVTSLQYPVQDAQNLVNTLTTSYNFEPKNVTFLKNPSRITIIQTFDDYAKKLTEEDNLLIFYAGHGYWDERLKQGYWLPVDATQSTRTEWISNGTIRDYVAGMGTKHTLLVSDACFSGGIFKTRDAFSKVSTATRELYRLPSRKAMTSGAMKEVPDKSVFVEYLIKRLKENTEALLPAETLFASFRQAVINNSPNRQMPQYGEIRETGDEGGDFIFVRR